MDSIYFEKKWHEGFSSRHPEIRYFFYGSSLEEIRKRVGGEIYIFTKGKTFAQITSTARNKAKSSSIFYFKKNKRLLPKKLRYIPVEDFIINPPLHVRIIIYNESD